MAQATPATPLLTAMVWVSHEYNRTCVPIQRSLVMQAVAKDSEGKIGSAVNYYCQALEYFIPALECE